MATGRITKRSVDAAGVGFLWDDELRGFGLKVTAAGSKSYVFQYRLGGRETNARRYTIGKHGSPWTPSTARQEAERLALMIKQGIDPSDHDRERRRQAVDLAFKTYADRFLASYVRSEWPSSYDFAEGILRLHVTPVLAAKALPTIRRSDVAEVLDRIPISKAALKRNVFAVVRRLFRWAVSRGDIERSPLDGFESPATVPSRERVLTDRELSLVWRASERLAYPFGPMFRLLVMSGQRREEVAALAWSELDRSTATWILPSERAKNSKAHIVPLTPSAVSIFDAIAGSARWPTRGFVFTTTGSTPASGHSRAKLRLDKAIAEIAREDVEGSRADEITDVPPWRVHDIRRTLATGLQRLGIRFEVTEAILNHVSGARSGVAGVYQRYDWENEKREALGRWAEAVEKWVSVPENEFTPPHTDKVVHLRAG